ncbi:MAG: PKD domain-containing protein, partial [Bacteroidota bacterium]
VNSSIALYDPSGNTTGVDTLIYNLTEPTLGCLIRDTIFVTIYSPTPGSVTIPDTSCIDVVLTFQNNQPGTQAVWNFGDGSPFVSATITTHSYPIAGNYQVELYTTNQFGCKDTIKKTLEVAMPPNAIFTLDTSRGCAILPLGIDNLSYFYGATIYAWDFGDGQTDTIYQPGTVFLDQGPGDSTIYHITLTASNGCGVATHEDSVTVYPIPVVDFGISMADSCSPATVYFANTTTGQPEEFIWFVNGVQVSMDSILAPQVFVTDSLDSTYTVTLVSTNFCGNDTLSKTVTIHPNTVTAFFSTDITYGCKPLTVNFSSFVGPDAVIQWDFGDGNTDIGYDVSHIFDTAGVFTVWQYVDNYCGFDSVSQIIEVLPQPVLSFTLDSLNCGNEVIQITNTSPDLQGYFWDFGDGTSLDSINYSPGHIYNSIGSFPVTLVGAASNTGCTDTMTLTANVIPYPSASFLVNDNDGCVPLSIQLTSTAQHASYYLWSLGNGDTLTGSTANYTYYQPNDFTLIHSVIDTN